MAKKKPPAFKLPTSVTVSAWEMPQSDVVYDNGQTRGKFELEGSLFQELSAHKGSILDKALKSQLEETAKQVIEKHAEEIQKSLRKTSSAMKAAGSSMADMQEAMRKLISSTSGVRKSMLEHGYTNRTYLQEPFQLNTEINPNTGNMEVTIQTRVPAFTPQYMGAKNKTGKELPAGAAIRFEENGDIEFDSPSLNIEASPNNQGINNTDVTVSVSKPKKDTPHTYENLEDLRKAMSEGNFAR